MLESHDMHENRETPRPEPMARDAADRGRAERPLLDREVPLPGSAGDPRSMTALHQWLDGEPLAADATVDPAQVAFWSRMSTETSRRRQVSVPDGFLDRVMASLPPVDSATESPVMTAATTATPVATTAGVPLSLALIIGTALLAVGVLIGRVLA